MIPTQPRSSLIRVRIAAVAASVLALAALLAVCRCNTNSVAAQLSKGGPGHSFYWGAQIGDQLTGEQAPWDMRAVHKFERLVGKNVSLVGFSAPFAECGRSRCSFYTFPTTPMEDLREHGTIPFFGWSTSSVSEGTHDPRFRLAKVVAGRYDHYIRQFAEDARNWGHPFFLRFNWEMNGNWFSWHEGVNHNRRGSFVKAWRHVHDIFTSVGADNATWVWCPNIDPGKTMANMSRLYPGNAYVDWTCLDGYNWGTRFNWSHWTKFDALYKSSYRKVVKIAPRKPMIIGEIASTTHGGSKAKWIRNMLHRVRHYPKIHGLVWFDVHDRGTNWPLETSGTATRAFAAGIRNPAFRPNLYSEISTNPIPVPGR